MITVLLTSALATASVPAGPPINTRPAVQTAAVPAAVAQAPPRFDRSRDDKDEP